MAGVALTIIAPKTAEAGCIGSLQKTEQIFARQPKRNEC
jgi:hypothetical protein